MKFFTAFIFLSLVYSNFHAVVINEVFYDPDGGDTGYEWIEFYNETDTVVDLENWIIQKAGSSFITIFTFPSIQIDSHQFLLLGESEVPETDLTANLAFQNGGTATDGIRLISADTLFTDTVLYDEPNTNMLPSDLSDPGIFFALDAGSGKSLARFFDGNDTGNCQTDFFVCDFPTPKSANIYPIDLAFSNPEIIEEDLTYKFSTVINNLSTMDVDNLVAYVEISVNNQLYDPLYLEAIPAQDSIYFEVILGTLTAGLNIIDATVNLSYDTQLENNNFTTSILVGRSLLVINEVLFKPETDSQEWIELFNNYSGVYIVDNFKISDESDGQIHFSGSIPPQSYLILCSDKPLFLQDYPLVDDVLVVETSSWTALNNSSEFLTLFDNYGTELENMNYDGSDAEVNISLERINPDLAPGNDNWGYSVNTSTPGVRNSLYLEYIPTSAKLNFQPNPFAPYNGEHCIISFQLPELLNRVSLKIYDLKGREMIKITNQTLQTAMGEFIWDGRNSSGKLLPVGVYIVLMEASALESEKIYRKQKTVIIAK